MADDYTTHWRETLPTKECIRDPRFQVREALDTDTVHRYSELESDGVILPPPTVGLLPDGKHYVLKGFHRMAAREARGIYEIDCDVLRLDWVSALKIALGGNAEHGLQMKDNDYGRAVRLAYEDETLRSMSLRELATLLGCGKNVVHRHRQKLEAAGAITLPTVIEGADGKKYQSTAGNQVSRRDTCQEPAKSVEVAEADDDFDPSQPETVEERMGRWNRAVVEWCGRVDALMNDVPRSEWVDDARVDMLRVDANRLAGHLRQWKAGKVHAKCSGKGCALCRWTGFLPDQVAKQYGDN